MVWSPGADTVEFRDVPRRLTLYTLMHFWLGTQNSIRAYQFKHFFYMNIKFDELLSI